MEDTAVRVNVVKETEETTLLQKEKEVGQESQKTAETALPDLSFNGSNKGLCSEIFDIPSSGTEKTEGLNNNLNLKRSRTNPIGHLPDANLEMPTAINSKFPPLIDVC